MVDDFEKIELDTSQLKPRVGIVGEVLIKYHPFGNNYVANLLEKEGAEVILPDFMGFVKFMATHKITFNELLNVIIASVLSTIFYCILCTICPVTPPISTVFLYLLILLMLVGGARFGYRFLRLYATRHHLLGRGEHIESRVMIIGAGSAGEKILRETLVTPKINKEVVCFIDDDLSKKGRRIHNVPVVGGRNEILQ